MPAKTINVEYDCEGCGKHCSTTAHNLKYRKHNQNRLLCQKCLIKLEKSAIVFATIPAKYHSQIFASCIDYKIAVRYLNNISTNCNVKFACSKCSANVLIRWNKLQERRFYKCVDVCGRCLQTMIHLDNDHLEANRQRSKLLWNDVKYKTACLKAFQLHNCRKQIDPEYARKYQRKCRSLTGSIKIGERSITFDSGYELIFIAATFDNCKIFRRCDFAIAYGSHFYHPDFFMISKDGRRTIVEVKGYYKDNLEEKQNAAKQYIIDTDIADEYVLYDHRRLVEDGILRGLGGANMWRQIKEISNGVVTFTNQQHQRIAEIGRSRYYKEIKNQVDQKATISR